MSMEQIDDLAARGAMSGLTFWKRKDGWQVNFQSAVTGGWACLTRDTPSEGLAAVLELNPTCEEYDTAHGHAKPVTADDVEEMLAPREFEDAALAEIDNADVIREQETESAGVFD